MECKSKKKLLLILLTAFVLFTFAPNVFATVNTPSFPTINVNQLTPTTIKRFNTEFEQNNLSYKMFIGSDGKTYLNVWSDGSGARDVYVWSATDNKWTFSATLSSNTLVKALKSRKHLLLHATLHGMSMCVVLVGVNQEKVVKHQIFQQAVEVMQGPLFQYF